MTYSIHCHHFVASNFQAVPSSPDAESEIRVGGIPLVERSKLNFRDQQLSRNLNQVNLVENIPRIKIQGGVFYAKKDLNE